MPASINNFIYVLLGSACGGGLRYLIGSYLILPLSPYNNTLLANIIACFIAGCLCIYTTVQLNNTIIAPLLLVGFCGGLSTMSTFSVELFNLIQQKQVLQAIIYLVGTQVLCLIACAGGYWLGRQIM
jgi:fluoride exporter